MVCCSEPGNPRIAVHIPRLSKKPLRLQFSGDTDMEDWMANLTSGKYDITKDFFTFHLLFSLLSSE